MEIYMDDMLIKSPSLHQHLIDLSKTFHILRKYKIKLNPLKYVFGVLAGKFLGL